MKRMHESGLKYLIWSILQAIRDGLSRASQEVSSAPSEEGKAEAQIAVECFEALEKAITK